MPPKPRTKGAGKAAKPKPKPAPKPIPMIWNPRLRQARRRLKELEEEKEKLERMLSQLRAKKAQKVEVHSDEGEFDGSSGSSGSSQQSAIHGGGSDVSSLGSRAHPLEESLRRQPKPAASRADYTSDISVMTDDIYHYDVRGRRVTDDDYGFADDTETTDAWHQDATGRAHNYSGNKQKASKPESEPRVWIEWKRGRTYQPDANLAFDAAIHMHPTDLSLLVADDKSFFDELSFSSGEDTFLKAAVTDMPMEIGMSMGLDNQSVNSALHSECSISVAPLPSKSMYVKSIRREPDLKHDARSAVAQFLYRRSESDDGSTTTTNTNSKRRRRRGQLSGEEDSPPPLTEDMSLVDERDLANTTHEPTKDPPFEISISGNKSDGSLESLGSQLGGASVAPTPQKSRSKNMSSGDTRIATPTEPHQKKNDKKKGKKSKQSAHKDNNMLGKRESWTEENELNAKVLAFDPSVKENSKEDKEATKSTTKTTDANTNGKYKSPATRTKTKKAANTAKKSSIAVPDLNNSASTLGDAPASGLNNEGDVASPKRATEVPQHNWTAKVGNTGLNGEAENAAPKRPAEIPQHNWATKGEATRLNGEGVVGASKKPAEGPQHNWTAKGGAAGANETVPKRPGEVPQHNWATNVKDPKGKAGRKTTEPLVVEGGALGQIIQEENEARVIPGPSEAPTEPTVKSGPSDEAPNKSGPSDEAPTKPPTKQPPKQSTKKPTKQPAKQPTKPMAVEGGILGEIIEQGIESAGKGCQ